MAAGFVLALLLCSGDNCDLVRLEPATSYPTYEACRNASEKGAAEIGKIASRYREPGRDADVICLRDRTETAAVPAMPIPSQQAPSALVATPPAPNPAAPQAEEETKLARAAAATTPPPRISPTSTQEFRDCEQCPVMVVVRGGSFNMGSNADPSERPPHHVSIAPFALGKFVVTESEWAACVAGSGCRYKGEGNSPDMPMHNLSWSDATQFAQWLRSMTGKPYRLPSEAEWEYAARAGTATRYPWGEAVGIGKADCTGCGGRLDGKGPVAVTAFPANPWGVFGMLGGVAEWTEDCWHLSYAGAPSDGSAWSAPRCPAHVLRGGSWMNPPSDITVSSRNFYDTDVRYEANGLRVALSLAAR
jgi:formylglycine-generating enzyme required for sulfatase activity